MADRLSCLNTQPEQKAESGSWQRNLWIIFFAQLTTMIGFSSIFPFLPFYIQSIGKVSCLDMGLLTGLVYSGQAFTMMVASPFWGALSDRFGRKLMVVRSMVGGAVIFILMAFARSAEELVILRAVQGMITGTVGAANALVAASAPKQQMGYAMGVLQMGQGLGLALGPLVGGLMADAFGFRAAFYLTGALLLLSGILVHFCVTENFQKPPASNKEQFGFLSEWAHVFAAKGVALIFGLRFLNQMGRMIFIPVLPFFVLKLIGDSENINGFTGLIVGVSAATMTASAIYLGKLGDRIGHRNVVVWASLSCVVFLGGQVFITTGWQMFILHALLGVALGGISPGISALLSGYTAKGEAGAVYGLDNSISSGARAMAPMLGVGISMSFGLRSVFGCSALIYLAAGLLAALALPRRDSPDQNS